MRGTIGRGGRCPSGNCELLKREDGPSARILFRMLEFGDQDGNDGRIAHFAKELSELSTGIAVERATQLLNQARHDGVANRTRPLVGILKGHGVTIADARDPVVEIGWVLDGHETGARKRHVLARPTYRR
jgi:hypothetical protein